MTDGKRPAEDALSIPAGRTKRGGSEVMLHVGDSVFETTTKVLLGQDYVSFFHAQLLGLWNNASSRLIAMTSCLTKILFYLRFGDLPGGHTHESCFLGKDHLKHLKSEAGFYLLPELARLCDKASDPYICFGSIGDHNGCCCVSIVSMLVHSKANA